MANLGYLSNKTLYCFIEILWWFGQAPWETKNHPKLWFINKFKNSIETLTGTLCLCYCYLLWWWQGGVCYLFTKRWCHLSSTFIILLVMFGWNRIHQLLKTMLYFKLSYPTIGIIYWGSRILRNKILGLGWTYFEFFFFGLAYVWFCNNGISSMLAGSELRFSLPPF